MSIHTHEHWMKKAIALAEQAAALDEVPIGAILVADNQIIGQGYNQPISSSDPTAHAEIVAIRQAAHDMGNYRLPNTTLYVTIEPCTMCVGAIIHARIATLVFGAREPRAGAVLSQGSLFDATHYNHRATVTEGILADQCGDLMRCFFESKRQ
jgi:tRNA(adenine34) deaminase